MKKRSRVLRQQHAKALTKKEQQQNNLKQSKLTRRTAARKTNRKKRREKLNWRNDRNNNNKNNNNNCTSLERGNAIHSTRVFFLFRFEYPLSYLFVTLFETSQKILTIRNTLTQTQMVLGPYQNKTKQTIEHCCAKRQ